MGFVRMDRLFRGTNGDDNGHRHGEAVTSTSSPGDRSIHSEDSIQNRIECSEYDLLFWLLIKSDKVTDIVSDKVESKSERIDYDYVIVDDIPEFDISPTIL